MRKLEEAARLKKEAEMTAGVKSADAESRAAEEAAREEKKRKEEKAARKAKKEAAKVPEANVIHVKTGKDGCHFLTLEQTNGLGNHLTAWLIEEEDRWNEHHQEIGIPPPLALYC